MLLLVSSPVLVCSSLGLNVLFCSLYCLCFCPQFCAGWVSKNASCDIETRSVVTPDVQHRPQKHKPLISTLRGWRQSLRCWHMHYHPRFTIIHCWDEWGELPFSTLLSQTLCKCWSCWLMGVFAQWLNLKLRKRGKEEGGKNSVDKEKNAVWQLLNSDLSILGRSEKFCLTRNSIFHLSLELFIPGDDALTLNFKSLYNGAFHFHKAKAEKF